MTIFTVTSGHTSTGLTLNYKDILNINSGGIVNGSVVSRGGTINVSAGGNTNSILINGNGALVVSGGDANSTIVNSGGSEYITSGGTAQNTIVYSGGAEYVYSGGIASGTTVYAGGSASIHLGGITSNVNVNSGGYLWLEVDSNISKTISDTEYVINGVTLHSGARLALQLEVGANLEINSKDIYTAVSINGGTEHILSGGIIRDSVVNTGGVENVHLGGIALGSVINDGGSESILLGGVASRTIVYSGGYLYVHSGGTANGATVNSGGNLWLEINSELVKTGANGEYTLNGVTFHSGAKLALQLDAGAKLDINTSDIYTAITNNGGTENILSGGVVSGAIINNGGVETIYSGGIASNTVVNNGTETILSGGIAQGTVINNGATEYLASGGIAINTVINSGGNLTLDLSADISKMGTAGEYIVNGVTLHDGAKLSLEANPNVSLYVNPGDSYLINRVNGSTQSVNLTDITKNTLINGGTEIVFSGGIVSGTIINNGGTENILSGGIASDTLVNSGIENILSDGKAINTIVNNGGELHFVKSAIIDNITLNFGAKLDFLDANVTSATVNNQNQLVLTNGGLTLKTIGLKGEYSKIGFVTHTDNQGGTLITELNLTGSVADFLANINLIPNTARYVIEDFDFNIANNLDVLQTNFTKIKSISLNDTNTTLTITETQLIRDTDALNLLDTYQLIVNNVVAVDAANIAANPKVSSISVSDSSSNIVSNLNALIQLGNTLTDISEIDATPSTIGLTATQYNALSSTKFNNFTAIVSGVLAANAAIAQSDSKVASFNILDTADNITTYLSALRNDTKLSSVILSDSIPSLTITPKQSQLNHNVLTKISDTYNLIVTGTNASEKLFDTVKSHAKMVGGGGVDTFNVTGTDTIMDLGKGGADNIKVGSRAIVNATIKSPWTATADTINYGQVNIATKGLAVNLSAVIKGTSGYKITNSGDATKLAGSAFSDLIIGGNGNDTLIGGLGKDTLTGGAGDDFFVFNSRPDSRSYYNYFYNTDIITDFVSGRDHLQFSKSVFTGLNTTAGQGNGTPLIVSEFVSSPTATRGGTAASHLIYNNLSGTLYYDADAYGSGIAVKVAILGTTTHPALAAADILIIA